MALWTDLLDDVCRIVGDGELERADYHLADVIDAAATSGEPTTVLETLESMADALEAHDLRHFWDCVVALGEPPALAS